MLNKNNIRELAYVVTIDDIKPIEGKNRVECAMVNGWSIMVRKDIFHSGDFAIYFEIDSKLPETEAFEFLAAKHYKIKTQKYKAGEGYFYSQGLVMAAADLNWEVTEEGIKDNKGIIHKIDDESRFLTSTLGVVYATEEDNKRKAKSVDKYKIMAQRHGKLFSRQPYRWLMKRNWGKKLLYLFYGKKTYKKSEWPSWVKKTDEERIENLPLIFEEDSSWIATEKLDGTSTTFTIRRKLFNHYDFFVCSRNVVFNKPDKTCFYDTNVYLEMENKYDIKNKMIEMMNTDFKDCEWITIQGETYGSGIQRRDYSLKEHNLAVFNFITSKEGRWNTVKMIAYLEPKNIPCVPILDINYTLPKTLEELRDYVDSKPSTIDGIIKEGIVFRSEDGTRSFKCVSPNYLAKYHC